MKVCTCCKELKSLDDFGTCSANKDGKKYQCKVCTSSKLSAYYRDNISMYKSKSAERRAKTREKIKERSKRYYDTHKLVLNTKSRAYYKENRERLIEAQKLTSSKWKSENKVKVNSYASKYRAKKRGSVVKWADKCKIERMYAKAKRLSIWTGNRYEVDHIVPLQSQQVCGLHCEANLQILPKSLNVSKGNRHWPDMWSN